MHIWGKGRAAGRVRLFVGNRGSGRVGSGQRFSGSGRVGSGRVGSKKRDPWTTLGCFAIKIYKTHLLCVRSVSDI